VVKRLQQLAPQAGAAGITGSRFERGIAYVDGHSSLGDDADWGAPTWSFTTEGRRRLLSAIDLICDNLQARFGLEAAWVGEPIKRTEPIARAKLRELIAENQLGNRVLYIVEASDPWFPLSVGPPQRTLTQEEQSLMDEARAHMNAIKPCRASSTSASLYVGELTLSVPLDRRPLDGLDVGDTLDPSLQLHMCTRRGGDLILGDWQDAHYAWDQEPTHPALKVEGHGAESRLEALRWLESEMRKPIVRYDWLLLGRTVCSGWWVHAPNRPDELLEVRGFLPMALAGRRRASTDVAAGYFDPWAPD